MVGTNPNTTRRREGQVVNLSYPVGEDPLRMVALRFVRYQRATPNVAAAEETTTTIFLPLPYNLPENTNMRTGTVDLGKFGAATSVDYKALMTQGASEFIDDIKSIGKIVNQDITKLGSAAALVPGIRDNARGQVVLGAVQNPHTTQFFEGVNLRSFTLTWRLMPRSIEESRRIKAIMDEIDMRTHPEETIARLVLDYPDLVYVDIIGDSKEFMPKYRRAFVTNVQKTFGVGNGMALFTSGAPVDMELAISFQEVEVVTRNVLRGEGDNPSLPDQGGVIGV